MVDYEGIAFDFESSREICQIPVVVYERRAYFDIFKLECFFLARVAADIFLEVRPVVVEKIRDDRFPCFVHQIVKPGVEVITMVVCDKREVEYFRKLFGAAVDEIDGKESFLSFDYVAHVVDVPHSWCFPDFYCADFFYDALKAFFEFFERGKPPRIAVFKVLTVCIGKHEICFFLPDIKSLFLCRTEAMCH